MTTNKFPEVTGKNLKRKKLTFPADFPAPYTIVLMAFFRHQQLDVDTWLPFANQVEAELQDVAYVEFPVVYKMGPLGQFMLNEGMRAGIPNPKARERTITLYLDKAKFLAGMEIQSEEQIQVLLVDRKGTILFHQTGSFTAEKGQELLGVLNQAQKK